MNNAIYLCINWSISIFYYYTSNDDDVVYCFVPLTCTQRVLLLGCFAIHTFNVRRRRGRPASFIVQCSAQCSTADKNDSRMAAPENRAMATAWERVWRLLLPHWSLSPNVELLFLFKQHGFHLIIFIFFFLLLLSLFCWELHVCSRSMASCTVACSTTLLFSIPHQFFTLII